MRKASAWSILIIFVSITSCISATLPNSFQANNVTINKSGWKIPGLSASRVITSRKRFQIFGQENIPVFITAFKPRRETVTSISFYNLSAEGNNILITQERLAIRSILRYDIKNHVFCYAVRAVGAFYDPETKRGGYGGNYILLYYDNDGDGIFESFETSGSVTSLTPGIPEWVLKR